MKSVVIIIDYFGYLPEYFNFFLETCKFNLSFNWVIHTDCIYEGEIPSNVSIKNITWDDYKIHVSKQLGINFNPSVPYKICDLKPAYAHIWPNDILGYDFWAFGDLDLIYGNLRKFYTEDKLKKYDIIGLHGWGISGPLNLMRNTLKVNSAYSNTYGWEKDFEYPNCVRFDEDIFLKGRSKTDVVFADFTCEFKEEYITPLVKGKWTGRYEVIHDDEWIWENGIIKNAKNKKEWICIHFMNYVSARYMDSSYGEIAPWKNGNIIHTGNPSAGFKVNLTGFHSL